MINGKGEKQTVAILVEEAKRLLELRDLVVGKLIRHCFAARPPKREGEAIGLPATGEGGGALPEMWMGGGRRPFIGAKKVQIIIGWESESTHFFNFVYSVNEVTILPFSYTRSVGVNNPPPSQVGN